MKKKKKIIWIVSLIAPVFFATLFFASLNNLNQNQHDLSLNQLSKNSSQKAINRNSSYVNYLNPGSAFTDPDLKSNVLTIYSKKPSQVTQQDMNKLFVLTDNIAPVGNQDGPKFTNLNKQTSGLLDGEPLDIFKPNSGTPPFSTTYLDQLGILTFRLVLTENTGVGTTQIHYEYFILSGFNLRTITTTLPGSFYQYTVNQLSTNQLESFISFISDSDSGTIKDRLPSIVLVPDSRINNDSNGSITFKLNLSYPLKPNLEFDVGKVNDRFLNDKISETNLFKVATSYETSLSYSGFQIGNALTNKQIYILLAIIAGVTLVVIALISLIVLVYKKIKVINS